MTARGGRLAVGGYSDLLLAALVVGVVAMMIIPLPTPVLDLLITTNISIAVLLLLISIYISNAIRIAAFPSILLITTLFRLGLNVSSTRLILLQADAGDVIASFGNFVVAGNLVVGAVVFLILTLIQFVVIAKGSERVAEVAARFTLDAMPGKQMAIDADLRGGAIDLDEARRQRSSLQRESQLYGSMDGAMKFVKGDAIAGILITIINIIGGLTIGVLQRGMSAGEAGALYTQLTIGDGLVSQIPALLISTAAGIVVTRVASEDEGSHLGRDIGQQVLAQPRAIAIAAALLVLLAVVPGLPTIPFLVLAAVLGLIAYRRVRVKAPRTRARRALPGFGGSDRTTSGEEETGEDEELPAPSAIALEVGEELAPMMEADSEGGQLLGELIPGLRELLYGDLGVVLPGVHVRARAPGVPSRAYRVLLAEVPLAQGALDPDRVVALAPAAELAAQGVSDVRDELPPGIAPPACTAPREVADALREAEIQVVEAPTLLVLHLGEILRRHAPELVGIQETQQLLDNLERTHPALVQEVVPKLVSVQTVAEVLRRLLSEGVPIRDLRGILEALAEWAPTERDPVMLTEYVRLGLKRLLSHQHTDPAGALRAFLLDPAIEEAVRESVQQTAKGSYLAIEPELSQDILAAVGGQLAQLPADEPTPVVLTNSELRRYVKRLIEVDHPQLPVLAFTELMPTVDVRLIARIGL
jgi:type III secretion protein V